MKIVLLIKTVIDVKSALQFGLPTEIKLAKTYSHHLLYLSKSPQVGSKFLKKTRSIMVFEAAINERK